MADAVAAGLLTAEFETGVVFVFESDKDATSVDADLDFPRNFLMSVAAAGLGELVLPEVPDKSNGPAVELPI